MPQTPNRQYRSFPASNFSAEKSDGGYRVRGYFTTFDEPYVLFDDFKEVIDRTAFDNADTSDVIFQLNHSGIVMARQKNGSLTIGFDEHGGWCEANLGGCQQGRDLYEAITSGLIDQMSFGFMLAEDGFDYDDATRTSRVTRISKVFDVSAVDNPANPGTEIHARSYLDGVIEAEEQELLQRDRDRRKRIAAALEITR